MPRYPWMLLCLFAICSCDEDRIYEDFATLPPYWHVEDEQVFEFEIDNDSLAYDLVAHFKQDIDYPHYNFYFMYKLMDGQDSVLQERLEQVIFYDPKTGAPFGSGVGDTFDHEFPLEDRFEFPGPGSYAISYRQFMRVDSVSNILRVGLRIDKAQAD